MRDVMGLQILIPQLLSMQQLFCTCHSPVPYDFLNYASTYKYFPRHITHYSYSLYISQQQKDHGGCCACTSRQQYNTSAVKHDQTSLESWYPLIIESTVKNSTSDTIVRIEHNKFPHTMKLLSGKTFTVSVQNSYLYENFCGKNFAVATHNANHKGHRLLYRVAFTNP